VIGSKGVNKSGEWVGSRGWWRGPAGRRRRSFRIDMAAKVVEVARQGLEGVNPSRGPGMQTRQQGVDRCRAGSGKAAGAESWRARFLGSSSWTRLHTFVWNASRSITVSSNAGEKWRSKYFKRGRSHAAASQRGRRSATLRRDQADWSIRRWWMA
jgi:hypothetical protein